MARVLRLLPLLIASSPMTGRAQTPPPEPWVCPRERRVTVVPKALKKQLGAATRSAEVKKLLEPLHLELQWNRYASCEEDAPASVVLDIFRARIVSAEMEDIVLQARGKICNNEAFFAGVVLHPLTEKNVYCSMNMPFLPGKPESAGSDPDATRIVFAFENLTDPVRKVIRAELNDCPRFCRSELTYWEAQDGALQEIFRIEWDSGAGPHGSSNTSVSVSAEGKEFPRKLRLKESVESCGSQVTLPSGATAYTSECNEASSEAVYCYQREEPRGPGRFNACGRRSSDD